MVGVVDLRTGRVLDEPSRDNRELSDNEVLSFADGFNRDNFGAGTDSEQPKEVKKRRGPGSSKLAIELGEEIDELPYKRPSRRGAGGSLLLLKQLPHPRTTVQQLPSSLSSSSVSDKIFLGGSEESIILGTGTGTGPVYPHGYPAGYPLPKTVTKRSSGIFKTTSTVNLLASRRIIDTFNVGDVAGIQSIIENAVTADCDICIYPLNQRLKGRTALMDLWESMLEAFPDGFFRASDTTINDKGELITRFVFTGAKQFNIVFGSNFTDAEYGEIINGRVLHDIGNNSNCNGSSSSSSSGSRGANSNSNSNNSMSSGNDNTNTNTNTNTNNESNITAKSTKKSKKDQLEIKPTPLICKANVATIGIDYSVPLIRSADLLLDDAQEKVYEGCMVMHTNEQYLICRLDYHWKKQSKRSIHM